MGFGGFAEPPKESVAYRRGYLCGMIRGDGSLRRYDTASRRCRATSFRLALADGEALARTRHYLVTFAVLTTEFDFSAGTWSRRPMRAIRSRFA